MDPHEMPRPPRKKPDKTKIKARRDDVEESGGASPEDLQMSRAINDFVRRSGQTWSTADAVFWMQRQDDEDGVVEETGKWLYRKDHALYEIESSPRTEGAPMVEYYIYAILRPRNKARAPEVRKHSLGVVCIGTRTFRAAAALDDMSPLAATSSVFGWVTRILAVLNDRDAKIRKQQQQTYTSSSHLQEVMRKQGLHHQSVSRNHPFLPTFVVMRRTEYLEALKQVQSFDTPQDQFEESLEVLEGDDFAKKTPHNTINDFIKEGHKMSTLHLMCENGLPDDGTPQQVAPGFHLRVERLARETDIRRTGPFKTALLGLGSASIPSGKLFEPRIVGDMFLLVRIQ